MTLHHRLDGPSDGAPLILGPSIGTSMRLWEPQLAALTRHHRVLRYDLPGHGGSPADIGDRRPMPSDPSSERGACSMSDLAELVLELADKQGWDTFAYAGVSLGAAIGARIAIDHPERVAELVLIATSARFGDPKPWHERAAMVREQGITEQLSAASLGRWFADPRTAGTDLGRALAGDLAAADREGYAQCCEALASHDIHADLHRISARTLVLVGRDDPSTPPPHARELADGIPGAALLEIPNAAHLPGVEQPEIVAEALVAHLQGERRTSGFAVRREVLGDAHVDRAIAATTPFTADFQDLITRYAWGEIWTRPGLDRRMRSAVTLTALVAGGHEKELAMHVRAALTNGLSREELKEILLQTAVYCGVPAANSAFAVAREVLAQIDEEEA